MTRQPSPSFQQVVFGKVPDRLDFLRINATHPVACEIDGLLQDAMERVSLQRGWQERMDAAPAADLFYPSRDRRGFFLGVLLPSRDQAGRRYPLVAGVACPLQALPDPLPLLPITWEVFLEGLRGHLEDTVRRTRDGSSCRRFLELQTAGWGPGSYELPVAGEIVARFLETRHPRILGGPRLRQVLLNLTFYRDFLRRFGGSPANQLIRLTLQGGPGEQALHASTWLTLLSILAGAPWSSDCLIQHEGGRAQLLTAFGQGAGWAFQAALGGAVPEEARLDLGREQEPWQSHKLYPETAYAMDHVLGDPALRISALCAFLEDVGRKFALAGT
jgi:type VI secretion system protein ImpM